MTALVNTLLVQDVQTLQHVTMTQHQPLMTGHVTAQVAQDVQTLQHVTMTQHQRSMTDLVITNLAHVQVISMEMG